MSVEDKLVTMGLLVKALESNRDYWRDRCAKQREALTTVSEMLMNVDKSSDEILAVLERATKGSDVSTENYANYF